MSKSQALRLSVVVPCYNEAGVIESCLDALLRQADDIYEIICVDNNSTDETRKILDRYAAKNAQIQVITESKQGVQFARNTGLDAARGEVIARIDADAVVRLDWAAALVDHYTRNNQAGIASGYSYFYDLPFRWVTQLFADLFTNIANYVFARSTSIYGANMSIRRTAWLAARGEACMINGIMEDQDLEYHVSRNGFNAGRINRAVASVSGRRMRMSPLRYWRYNKQWWMTYANHGQHVRALFIRLAAWFGNLLQVIAWAVLLFHNPKTNRFSLVYAFNEKDTERQIP